MFQLLNPLLHDLALGFHGPVSPLHGLALTLQYLAVLLEDPHPVLSLGQGAAQRLDFLPVLRLGSASTHARSLSRNASCNGYTYTAFTGTFRVPCRSPRLRPRVRPTSFQLLAV